jgi:hypothetical protein
LRWVLQTSCLCRNQSLSLRYVFPHKKEGAASRGEEPAPYVRLLGEEGGAGVDKQATAYIARVLSVHQQFGGA